MNKRRLERRKIQSKKDKEMYKFEHPLLNVIVCEGATCVSINDNTDKYYAEHVRSRRVKYSSSRI